MTVDKLTKLQKKLKENEKGMVVVIDPFQKEKYNNNKLMKEIRTLQKEFQIKKENVTFLMLHELSASVIEKINNISPAFVIFNNEKIELIQRGY